jgi:hypothetical protein
MFAMAENDRTQSLKEIETRLSTLISEMSEDEKRDLLERLENWQESKHADKRKHTRKQASIYGVFSGHNAYFRDYIQNISISGIFIETQTPLFVNQELTTTFFLPGSKTPVKAKGKVVRTDSKGIAIQFDEAIPDI